MLTCYYYKCEDFKENFRWIYIRPTLQENMSESSAVSLDTRDDYNSKEVTNCETYAMMHHDYQERLCSNDQQGQANILRLVKYRQRRIGAPSIFTVEVYCYCRNRDDGSKMVQYNMCRDWFHVKET